jgi:hypothetical protein
MTCPRINVCARLLFCLIFLLASAPVTRAQPGRQLWVELQTSYPFANRYLLENTLTWQTLLSGGETWTSLTMSPTFEMVLTPKIEFTFEAPLGWTRQNNTLSSSEISPITGFRFHITQGKRVDTRILTRVQSRNVHQIESDVWEHKGRFRLKGEAWISITGPNLFTDKLLYAMVDYEEFIVVDEQVNERYANLRRARLGLGYRFNYQHRLDLIYTWQYSRNELGIPFDQTDSVIQLKYKLFFNVATTP